MNYKEHWRLRLQELLASTHLKQAAFADLVGVPPDYLSRLLYPQGKAGRKNMGELTIRKVCAAFDLPREWWDLPLGAELPGGGTAPAVNEVKPTDKGRASTPIEWPFRIVSYQRIRCLRQYYGRRGMPEAISDIDKHLDVLVTRWEVEMNRNKSSAA